MEINSIQVTHRNDVIATLTENIQEEKIWRTADGMQVTDVEEIMWLFSMVEEGGSIFSIWRGEQLDDGVRVCVQL